MDKTQNGGISFLGALQLIFITLKLTETINWSWWLVLLPLILLPALIVIVTIGFLTHYFFTEYMTHKKTFKINSIPTIQNTNKEYCFTGIVKYEKYSTGDATWIEDIEDPNTRITALDLDDIFTAGDLLSITIIEQRRQN